MSIRVPKRLIDCDNPAVGAHAARAVMSRSPTQTKNDHGCGLSKWTDSIAMAKQRELGNVHMVELAQPIRLSKSILPGM